MYFEVKKNTKNLSLFILEKKSLHESAVGDPEIVPSKKRKIGSKMPLTRSKVCLFMWFVLF